MAIQSELERLHSPYMTADIQTKNRQHYQQHWLQVISNQNSRSTPAPTQYLPLPVSNPTPAITHESRVRWFACQLAKETLRQYLNTAPVPSPLPNDRPLFDFLPQDVIIRICKYVPYEDLLCLYQLSRTLNRTIDPRLASTETKLSFVLRAERDFPQHYTGKPQNLGCYMCYRVLPAGVFASNQPLQAMLRTSPGEMQSVVNLRRFCIYCGIQSGCHNPGDELNMRTGERFWICDCLNVMSDNMPACDDCRTLCPLSPRGLGQESSRRSRDRLWGLVN